MDLKYALQVVRDTRDEWYQPNLSKSSKNDQIKMAAYASWACDEIYLYLLFRNAIDPICAVRELLLIAENAAADAKNTDVNLMYLTLCDACREFDDILRLIEGEKHDFCFM